MTAAPTNIPNSTLLFSRNLIFLLTIPWLLSSCTQGSEKTDHGQQSTDSQNTSIANYLDTAEELTTAQQSAFDALITLQVNTDDKNLLYSTFAGITHPFYPPDTSITISRADLFMAMEHFVTRHCTNLPINERNELASRAVLAQEEYTVFHCIANSSSVNYENGLPMTGTWVMPCVLGRRDVIIVWEKTLDNYAR